MKKTILLLILTSLGYVSLSAKDSHAKIIKSMIEPVIADNWNYSTDSIDISMNLESGNFYFQLKNNTSHRIYIEWENARVNGEKPFFGTDNLLSSKNKKEDEAIMSGSYSIHQSLFIKNPFYTGTSSFVSWAKPPYNYQLLKKAGRDFIQFNLPLRDEKGKTKDIKFNLEIKWVNTADLSLIQIGMKVKDIKKLIGSPEFKDKDKNEDKEVWHYTNNGNVIIVKGKVTDIEKE